jgi:hypothetical protein
MRLVICAVQKKTIFSGSLRSKKNILFVMVWALCIVGIGIAVLHWRVVRRPVVCHANAVPECVVMPVKQRMQYGIYDEIVSHDKKNQTVRLLPPDHVPNIDDADHGDAVSSVDAGVPQPNPGSVLKEGQRTTSANNGTKAMAPKIISGDALQDNQRTTSANNGTKAMAPKIISGDALQDNQRTPSTNDGPKGGKEKKGHQTKGIASSLVTLRIRIGNGFADEAKARHSLVVLVRDGLVPYAWQSKVMLRGLDDLRFAVFLWGDMTASDWAQYQNTLRKHGVPYTVIDQGTKKPSTGRTAS